MTDASFQEIERQCWCGETTARVTTSFDLPDLGSFQMVRCQGCGVFALHPQPTDEQLLSAYSMEYYGSSREKFVGPIPTLVRQFQGGRARLASRIVPQGGRVLDVGCGNGGFLIQMMERGFRVEGTEWTAESAARVPVESGIAVHVGDLLSLDLNEGAYDLLTMWHVLEHVRNPMETLQLIFRLLKPDGSLLLAVPNAESRQALRFGSAWFHHDPPRHLYGFGPQSLKRLMSICGFDVEWINTFSLEQNPFGFIQSWLNRGRAGRGGTRDRLYSSLKGLRDHRAAARLLDLSTAAALAIPALAVSTVESAVGRGATMTVRARKAASRA